LSKVSPENLLLMGKVIRPHGLDGRLRVLSYAQSETSFIHAGKVYLTQESGELHEHKVISVRPHKNILLLQLENLRSVEDAEKYRGADVSISKEALRHTEDEEYYWYELMGLKVYTDEGTYLGTIRHIFQTKSNDIYVIREGERELLIPAVREVVQAIDLDKERMTISPMEGLLDLDED
jgi:16S rRNA processing protein RimM